MARNRPGGKNIIAIILGASSFPDYKTLDASPAFAASATAFRDYLRTRLSLPESHILPLFDEALQPGEQLKRIKDFIRQHVFENAEVSDVIFYYCGHGAYLSEDEYVLALKCTDVDSKEATVFRVSYLVDLIADLTREKRNLVVLDACYSGAALSDFIRMSEHDAAHDVTQQFYSIVPNPEGEENAPDESGGAILFCAAGPKKWAKTPLEAKYTMFSGALNAALDEGDPKGGPDLTLKRIAQLVDAKIRRTFGREAVKPQVHVPVQGMSDLLESPFFPNPAFGAPLLEDRLQKVEATLDEIGKSVDSLSRAVKSLTSPNSSTGPSATTTSGSLGTALSFVIKSKLATTLFVCLALNVLTFFALKWSVVLNDENLFNALRPYIIIGVAHALVVSFALIVITAQSAKEREPWLGLFAQSVPKDISYWALALNSAAAIVAIVWLSQLPPTTIASALPVSDIARIQRALCLKPTEKLDPETRAGIRDFIRGRSESTDGRPDVKAFAFIQLISDAVGSVSNCAESNFKNAFEVGFFAVPERTDRNVRGFQMALSRALDKPLVATGVLDAQTRAAIADLRKLKGVPPGDTVDPELLSMVR